MNFEETGLPDRQLLRTSFDAGWEIYKELVPGSRLSASLRYLRGPVAMARLILERGGDCHQAAAAACLAGPALFSATPEEKLDKKTLQLGMEIAAVEKIETYALHGFLPRLSADARLFLQVSAIMLLDTIAAEHKASSDGTELQKDYIEALALYSAARGGQDTYRLDTRFEIAAMKVTTIMDNRSHIWVRFRQDAARLAYV